MSPPRHPICVAGRLGAILCALAGGACRAAAAPTPPANLAGTADQGRATGPDRGLYVHAGPGALLFSEGAKLRAAGTLIPGGTISIAADETLIVETGYHWGNFALSLTSGIPPQAKVDGAGSLAPLGALGRIVYGPVVLSGLYRIPGFGRLHPYVGGGPVFLLIFDNKDNAARNLDVHSSVGVAVQGGGTFDLTPHWGLFLDVKKGHLRTTATAMLDGAPITAHIRLDPLVLSGGLAFHF